jgi:CheY-like chemotaxis protein
MLHRPVEILLVDDSPADVRLTREALLQGPIPKRISVAMDGAEAMDFLHKRGQFSRAPRPDIILLDLNLPKRDGLEVLREVKADPDLRTITIIVLTTSTASRDVSKAYELLANCYIVKPTELDDFYSVMRGIEEFWMSMVSLPTLDRDPQPWYERSGPGGEDTPKKGTATAGSEASGHCLGWSSHASKGRGAAGVTSLCFSRLRAGRSARRCAVTRRLTW